MNTPTDTEIPFKRTAHFANSRLAILGFCHIPVFVVAYFYSHSTDLFAFMATMIPVGLILHGVALIQAEGKSARWRAIGRGLVAALVCLFGWILFFLLVGMLLQNSGVLMIGLVASFPLALLTSGLGAALHIVPLGRERVSISNGADVDRIKPRES